MIPMSDFFRGAVQGFCCGDSNLSSTEFFHDLMTASIDTRGILAGVTVNSFAFGFLLLFNFRCVLFLSAHI
jgi:hypothetical protein